MFVQVSKECWITCNADNFWSARDIRLLLLEMWIEAFWRCLQNIFQLFETICYQIFCKDSTLFTTKTRFSNEFSQHYWQKSFNGDSFASQSRFDACTNQHLCSMTDVWPTFFQFQKKFGGPTAFKLKCFDTI